MTEKMMRRRWPALEAKAREIRRQVLQMCVRAKTGHVTSSFSCVEILVALYHGEILRGDPARPRWAERDRFLLSKGQASPALYAVLADRGYFSAEALEKFCAPGGPFGVHLQHDVPGVEITSGSLGHGLGIAAGMALAARRLGQSHRVITLLGDGECYEGSIWEAALFAAHHRLGNLVAVIDRNRLCVTGFTEKIARLEPLEEKWRSFGWQAVRICGHSFREIFAAFPRRAPRSGPPLAIVANTVKGKGVPFMENQPLWHGVAPCGEEAQRAALALAKGRCR